MSRGQVKPSIERRSKVALVVGIDNYKWMNKLKNAVKDANKMALTLEKIGFTVTKSLNPTHDEFENLVLNFKRIIRKNDIVLFYFAGHGVQWEGECFLVPQEDSDGDDVSFYNMIKSNGATETPAMTYGDIEAAAKRYMIRVMGVVDEFSCRTPYCTLFLLDCCRVDLARKAYKKDWREPNRTSESLVSALIVNAGYLIGYACAPATRASDNQSQQNGLYTKHLLQYLSQPNLDIHKIMAAVTNAVTVESNCRQMPQCTVAI